MDRLHRQASAAVHRLGNLRHHGAQIHHSPRERNATLLTPFASPKQLVGSKSRLFVPLSTIKRRVSIGTSKGARGWGKKRLRSALLIGTRCLLGALGADEAAGLVAVNVQGCRRKMSSRSASASSKRKDAVDSGPSNAPFEV